MGIVKTLLAICLLMPTLVYGHAKLTIPNEGDSFAYGQNVNIQWQILIGHATLENWDLYYSLDGGLTWNTIVLDLPAGTLTYNWIIPSTSTSLAQIRVVMDNSDLDYEDLSGNFTISETLATNKQLLEGLTISQNPLIDEARITMNTPHAEKISLILINNMGEIVENISPISATEFIIQRRNLPSGFYFIRLNSFDTAQAIKIFIP